MQPVAAADAIRFLPGAVVNTVGQRGGQASLFVRGGDSRYNKVIIDGVPVNDPGGIFDFGVPSHSPAPTGWSSCAVPRARSMGPTR